MQEKEQRSQCIVNTTSKEVNIKQTGLQNGKTFTYDQVFGQKSAQMDVYTKVVSPLIQEVLAGYNCTVFAYGQTGTGKTYTMAGGSEKTTDVSWQNVSMYDVIKTVWTNLSMNNASYSSYQKSLGFPTVTGLKKFL